MCIDDVYVSHVCNIVSTWDGELLWICIMIDVHIFPSLLCACIYIHMYMYAYRFFECTVHKIVISTSVYLLANVLPCTDNC